MPSFADAAGFSPTTLALLVLLLVCAIAFLLVARVALGLWEGRRAGDIEPTHALGYVMRAAAALVVLVLVLL